MVRPAFVHRTLLTLALAACGAEPPSPGTLTISLDALAAVVSSTTLVVSGQVQRLPTAADLPIVVSVTLGAVARSDTAAAGGAFSIEIALQPNTQNQVSVSASDPTGSAATPVTVAVRHDDRPPSVTTFTPAHQADLVTPTTITVQFNERIQPGSPQLSVTRQGVPVAGAVQISADSLGLTFTPAAAFPANAIHNVILSEVRDLAGNRTLDVSTCFVTAGATATFADSTNDTFLAGAPGASLVVLDMTQVRFSQTSTHLFGVVRFTTPRTLDPSSPSNVFIVVDMDTDLDGATGFTTVKDTAFGTLLPNSGTRAEYGLWLLPQQGPEDSAIVVQYTGPLDGTISNPFLPSLCGTAVGFVVPRAALGNEDGAFRAVLYSDAFDGSGGYGDPAPDAGFFEAALPGSPFASPTAVAPGSRRTLSPSIRARVLHSLFGSPRGH